MCGHIGATAARNNWWLLVELNINRVRWLFDPPVGGAAEQPCADDRGMARRCARPSREAGPARSASFFSDPLALSRLLIAGLSCASCKLAKGVDITVGT